MDRFKIVQILEEKPVLLCEVEILDDEDEEHPEVRQTSHLAAYMQLAAIQPITSKLLMPFYRFAMLWRWQQL